MWYMKDTKKRGSIWGCVYLNILYDGFYLFFKFEIKFFFKIWVNIRVTSLCLFYRYRNGSIKEKELKVSGNVKVKGFDEVYFYFLDFIVFFSR